MNLTKNFTLEEMLRSESASRKGFDEQFRPSQAVIDNLTALCKNVLQPLREQLRKSIAVTSGYRCKRVNTDIGGSATSQHLKGQAADIHVPGMADIEAFFQRVKNSGLPYDQLIQEFNNWVHVSYDPQKTKQRRQALRATRDANGKTKYTPA